MGLHIYFGKRPLSCFLSLTILIVILGIAKSQLDIPGNYHRFKNQNNYKSTDQWSQSKTPTVVSATSTHRHVWHNFGGNFDSKLTSNWNDGSKFPSQQRQNSRAKEFKLTPSPWSISSSSQQTDPWVQKSPKRSRDPQTYQDHPRPYSDDKYSPSYGRYDPKARDVTQRPKKVKNNDKYLSSSYQYSGQQSKVSYTNPLSYSGQGQSQSRSNIYNDQNKGKNIPNYYDPPVGHDLYGYSQNKYYSSPTTIPPSAPTHTNWYVNDVPKRSQEMKTPQGSFEGSRHSQEIGQNEDSKFNSRISQEVFTSFEESDPRPPIGSMTNKNEEPHYGDTGPGHESMSSSAEVIHTHSYSDNRPSPHFYSDQDDPTPPRMTNERPEYSQNVKLLSFENFEKPQKNYINLTPTSIKNKKNFGPPSLIIELIHAPPPTPTTLMPPRSRVYSHGLGQGQDFESSAFAPPSSSPWSSMSIPVRDGQLDGMSSNEGNPNSIEFNSKYKPSGSSLSRIRDGFEPSSKFGVQKSKLSPSPPPPWTMSHGGEDFEGKSNSVSKLYNNRNYDPYTYNEYDMRSNMIDHDEYSYKQKRAPSPPSIPMGWYETPPKYSPIIQPIPTNWGDDYGRTVGVASELSGNLKRPMRKTNVDKIVGKFNNAICEYYSRLHKKKFKKSFCNKYRHH